MKNLFKKLLPALIVAIVLVCALAVTVFATDDWMGTVELLDMTNTGVVEKSNYTDIDGNPDWIQVASNSGSKTRAKDSGHLYWAWGIKAYFNEKTSTLAIVSNGQTATFSGRTLVSGHDYGYGEDRISSADQENPDYAGMWGVRWATDKEPCWYVHSFVTWVKENADKVKCIELRPNSATAASKVTVAEAFSDTYMKYLTSVEKVKYTIGFTFRAGGAGEEHTNVFFANKPKLTDVQYGTYTADGKFTTECPVNAVTLAEGNVTGDNFGICTLTFTGCSSVQRVIIETNTTGKYLGLKSGAFSNCTSLKFLYINTAMSDSYLVGTTPFSGCSGVNVYVNDISAATALAAVDGITLKAHTAYDADIKDYFSKNAPIYADGVLVKIADADTAAGDNVAIRFLFRWDAANTPAAGTPVKVGVVACTADYYAGLGSGSEAEKLVSLLADPNTKRVKKNDIAVYDEGKLSLKGKFLKEGTDVANGIYCYAYTLYGIPSANYDSEVYAATYIQWSDGTYSIASNSYTDSTGANKNTISLYDVTLGLFKRGLINSEKVADKYLWDVLKSVSGDKTNTLTGTDATKGINVTYFYLTDNIKGGYVLAYRATEKFDTDGVTLKGATMPHNANYKYVSPFEHKTLGVYYNETHTIVIDHGITAFGGARIFGPYSGGSNISIKNIVYPSGMIDLTAGTHFVQHCDALENIIWCHTDANGNYVTHMADITWDSGVQQRNQLFDMRGFGSLMPVAAFSNFTVLAKTFEDGKRNVVFAIDSTMSTDPKTYNQWGTYNTRVVFWKS